MKFKPNQKVLIYDDSTLDEIIAKGIFIEVEGGIGPECYIVQVEEAYDKLYDMTIGVKLAFNPDHLMPDRSILEDI